MTIEWHYTAKEDFGLLSLSGYLGPEGAHRFAGAIGWVLARGTGPVVVDMTALRGWSVEGQVAVTEAAGRLCAHERSLELAAIPADGSLVPTGDGPPVTVHSDLSSALSAHGVRDQADDGQQEWRTSGWPS
ncbi:anti-sigma factor antagonist [Streptomyces sp. NBC_00243]|uniref:anti-sigma factor antagonist n=1 Tax=Streptomyces sp. NBC_00243 TaxID=2975688 RepID=UPI002DDABF17|nr:anti-sigma factor antagonist [Streptomyces sp. NBC_00243]WRZ18899.1 anti-sigma factor antagonist [Streptomyces sp. NBC_00243]